jgi:oligoribonuclease (3'-5' exoribonuclease)
MDLEMTGLDPARNVIVEIATLITDDNVSTVKELCRRWYPGVLAKAPEKKTAHRALDDVLESVAELAFYRDTIFAPPSPASRPDDTTDPKSPGLGSAS